MTESARGGGACREVDAIADAFVDAYCALDPTAATEYGVAGHEHRLTDLSPEGFADREQLVRRTLRAVAPVAPADEREAVAKEAFVERLGVTAERLGAGIAQSELSVASSALHELRLAFDLMDADGEQAWSNVDARLAGVPGVLDGFRRTLLGCVVAGHVSARRQLAEVAGQVRGWTGRQGEAGDYFARLVGAAEVTGALGARLHAHARDASSALSEFARFLEEEMVPRGREQEAVGRERYALCSRYFLGADLDLDETYAWGWHELRRVELEMAQVAGEIVPGGSVESAVSALDSDPARTVRGREAFREWMQRLADRVVDELAGVHFDIPDPIRRIECRIAPTNDGGIYYTPPSEDFARPGRMWWAVLNGSSEFSTWRQLSTVFHEGVPGHHLQVAQTAYRANRLNRWQRLICWVSGHGEGWALYAERLMAELGYLDDPGDRLGMLDAQRLRAARVVLDIGLHLGLAIPRDDPGRFHPGERWTPQLGLEFLREHSRLEDAVVRYEVDRYLGWPGQAPSYKVGERIWMEAREAARARLGERFDLRSFHRAALDLGSLGLDPLRHALARL